MPRQELADPGDDGHVSWNAQVAEVLHERARTQIPADLRLRQERLELGREQKPPGSFRVIERLDSHAISGERQRPLPAIPDGEREHSPEEPDAIRSPLLVEVDDDLGVARGAERVSLRL